LAKSAANYSNNGSNTGGGGEKIRRDTETDQISGNKISKYGGEEKVRIMCKIFFFFVV